MKLSATTAGLADAFAAASGCSPARSPRAILQNYLLTATDLGTTLSATDLEIGIRHNVLGVKVATPGRAVLPPARFGAILKTDQCGELSVEVNGEIHVAAERAEFKLVAQDPAIFPDVPDFTATSYYALDAADLRSLIRHTSYATDTAANGRYALGGALLVFGAGTLSLVATDGRRLAMMAAPCRAVGEPLAPPSAVVPLKALKLIDRNLGEGEVELALTDKAIHVRTATAVLYARLIEGRFPKYEAVFPGTHATRVRCQAGDLLSVVIQAAIVTSDESRGVDFRLAADLLTLASTSADVGQSSVVLGVVQDGPGQTFTADPRFLSQALQPLDPEAEVTLELIDAKNAVVLRCGEYVAVVMPLTRDR